MPPGKKFDLVHQTVSPRESVGSRNKARMRSGDKTRMRSGNETGMSLGTRLG